LVDGTIFTTTLGIYVRVNGATVGPLAVAGGNPALDSVTNPSGAKTFTLLDNNASSLSFGATGKGDILKIITTDNGEGVSMSGTLSVTGAVTGGTFNGHTFTSGSSTFTGTAGQTYTFPSTTSTLLATTGSPAAMVIASQAQDDILTASSASAWARLNLTEQTLLGRVTGGHNAAIAIDADLTSTSASDDTVPSAKATKAMGDLKLTIAPPASVDGSAAANLSAAALSDPRCSVTNYGQTTADVAITLPTAAANLSCLFNVYTARSNKWGVRAGASDLIYLVAADGTIAKGSDNGYARMTAAQEGQSFACWSITTGSGVFDWSCKAIAIGTSTFAAN
jgi:hypothetical protein